jgi:hypothetical protein
MFAGPPVHAALPRRGVSIQHRPARLGQRRTRDPRRVTHPTRRPVSPPGRTADAVASHVTRPISYAFRPMAHGARPVTILSGRLPSEEVTHVLDVRSAEGTSVVGLEVVALGYGPRFEFVHCDAAAAVGTRYLRHERCVYGPNT